MSDSKVADEQLIEQRRAAMLSFDTDVIPEPLRAVPQWIFWARKDGRKVPHTTMGYGASDTNPDHWSGFRFALQIYRAKYRYYDGLGYVIRAGGGVAGLDADDCLDENGEPLPWAAAFLARLSDTYLEVSPSGRGVKAWVAANVDSGLKAKTAGGGGLEIYGRDRYFTVTTKRFRNAPSVVADHQADVDALLKLYRGSRGQGQGKSRTIPERITEGTRNSTLVSLAGTMRRRGMCLAAIGAALLKVNECQCEPPLPEPEVAQILRSVEKWAR